VIIHDPEAGPCESPPLMDDKASRELTCVDAPGTYETIRSQSHWDRMADSAGGERLGCCVASLLGVGTTALIRNEVPIRVRFLHFTGCVVDSPDSCSEDCLSSCYGSRRLEDQLEDVSTFCPTTIRNGPSRSITADGPTSLRWHCNHRLGQNDQTYTASLHVSAIGAEAAELSRLG
jgi:hypothetical protein